MFTVFFILLSWLGNTTLLFATPVSLPHHASHLNHLSSADAAQANSYQKSLTPSNDAKSVTSNAFNFASMQKSSVDQRTGTYNFQYVLGNIKGNNGFGPNFTLKLSYSTANPDRKTFGYGWSMNVTHYDAKTKMLSLSSGTTYTLRWEGNKPYIVDYKLDNIHLASDPSGKYSLIITQKNGHQEYLNSFGYLVKIENRRGDTLNFIYDNPATGTLDSIKDQQGQSLLTIVHQGTTIQVNTISSQGKMLETLFNVSGSLLESIQVPSINYSVDFTYITKNNYHLISNTKTSSGASSSLQYRTIPMLSGAPNLKQNVVYKYTKSPGFNQTNTVLTYDYTLNQNHNYLGYGSGIAYRPDIDNLYLVPDNYNYSSKVTDDQGLSVTYTYNKFHLPYKQELKDPSSGQTVSQVDIQYPNWQGIVCR